MTISRKRGSCLKPRLRLQPYSALTREYDGLLGISYSAKPCSNSLAMFVLRRMEIDAGNVGGNCSSSPGIALNRRDIEPPKGGQWYPRAAMRCRLPSLAAPDGLDRRQNHGHPKAPLDSLGGATRHVPKSQTSRCNPSSVNPGQQVAHA